MYSSVLIKHPGSPVFIHYTSYNSLMAIINIRDIICLTAAGAEPIGDILGFLGIRMPEDDNSHAAGGGVLLNNNTTAYALLLATSSSL